MNVIEYLQSLADQGIQLRVGEGRLRCLGPKERVTPALLGQLQQHKETLLSWLQQRESAQTPLSYSQQAYWEAYQLEPNTASGNISVVVEVELTLDPVALAQAFQDVLMQHAILRTTYGSSEGVPYGQIQTQPGAELVVVNTRGWDAVQLQQQVESAISRPLILEQSPIRVTLFFDSSLEDGVVGNSNQAQTTQAAQGNLLVLVMHHIAIDGLAFSILLHDLCTCYAARKSGNQPALPAAPFEYRDFVRWEADQWQTEQARLTAYWHQQLSAPLPIFTLPAGEPSLHLPIVPKTSYDFALSQPLTQQLKQLAQTHGVTLATVFMTAFAVLLQHYAKQSNILIMMPVSRRELTEFSGVVGDFSDQVILRFDLAGNPTFTTLFAKIQATVVAALQHQGYPFPLLLQNQALFDLNQTRLTDLCIGFAPPLIALPQDGLIKRIVEYCKVQTTGTDLILFITEIEHASSGYFLYNSDRFDPTVIERMTSHFQPMLSMMIANAEQPIGSLRLLTAHEQAQTSEVRPSPILSASITTPWVQSARPNPQAKLRIFCFPNAGGGASLYHAWGEMLPSAIEVCPIQLPGHETRLHETPFTDLTALIDRLSAELHPYLDKPFAFFGHSMGSLIAYALTQKLQSVYGLLPTHLFVSGYCAPHLPNPRLQTLNAATDDLLAKTQQIFGGIPAQIFQDTELTDLLTQLLRADFRLAESYPPNKATVVDCPILAFGGDRDFYATRAELLAWQNLTNTYFAMYLLPGGHFYLNEQRSSLLTLLCEALLPHY